MKHSDSSSKPSPKRKCGRCKKVAISVVTLFALYLLIGFFVVPLIVRAVANSQVEKNLHAHLEMESVSFNPLTLRLTLDQISLKSLENEDILSLGNGQFAISLSSITHLAPVLKEVLLDKPALFLARDPEGSINLLGLLKETEKEPSSDLPKIAIHRLAITDGSIELKDEALQDPVSLSFSPITFDLNDFSTFDEEGNQLRFAATSLSGGSIVGSGSFNVDPISATAELELNDFDITSFAAYVREFVDVDLRQGEVDLQMTVHFRADSEEEMISGNLASFALSNFTVFKTDAEDPFFSLGEVKIGNAEFAAWEPRLTVESITISDGNARVHRLEDGSIDLLALLPPSEDSSLNKPTADPLPLSFSIANVAIEHFGFSVVDFTTGEEALLDGNLEKAVFQSISENLNQPIPFELNGFLLEEGRFSFAGNVTPGTLTGEVDFAIESIPLTRFNPWAPLFTDLSLHSGIAGTEGKIELSDSGEDLPIILFTGKSEVKNLDLREGENPILGFNNLLLDNLAIQSDPLSIEGNLIELTEPHASLVLEEDQNLNILRLLRIGEAPESEIVSQPSTESPEAATGFPLTYKIDAIRIRGGDIEFSDQTVAPVYATRLNHLDAEISGFASDPDSRATVNLSGNLPNASRLTIAGTTNAQPEDLYADMKVSLAGFALSPASSYSGLIIGRTISQGRLDFNTAAKVENDNLSAQNIILLKDFRLGDRVENSDAPNLPLDLALGLLRNRNGEISLEIPLSGQIDDPQFSIASVATNALFTVIRNIASSPFSVLGNLVGGKSEKDLSELIFAPGTSALSDNNLETLRNLSDALSQRPSLNIEISASADPATDRPILLENRLRAEILAHQEKSGAVAEFPNEDPLNDPGLLLALYEERFGPLEIPEPPIEEIEIAEPEPDFPEVSEETEIVSIEPEPVPEDLTEEIEPAKKPFIVVKIPQWVKKLSAKFSRSPEIELAEEDSPSAVETEPVPSELPEEIDEPETVETDVADAEISEPEPVKPEIVIPSIEEMQEKLLATIEITDADLLRLAEERMTTVKEALLATDQLEPDRISTGTSGMDSHTKAEFKLH